MRFALVKKSLVVLAGLSFAFVAFADDHMEEKKELPKRGLLGSSASGGTGSHGVDMPVGGVDPTGETSSPLTGSVSRISKTEWQARE